MSAAPDEIFTIRGKRVGVTNRDKIFWPKERYTKGNVIDYYRSIAPFILPYLKNRPESMLRHPNGIKGESFFQKNVVHPPPPWVKTIKIYSESGDKTMNYLMCQDEATLVYMANLGCIEINPWHSRDPNLDYPDYCVIDLDPEAISFAQVIATATVVREVLEGAGVQSYCKTSGKTGLHIYIPLGARYNYDQCKQFAEIIAVTVNERLPRITSVVRAPAQRQRKVYVDFLQNRYAQTLAAPYSLRPWPGATISAPLEWDEVRPGLDPRKFNIETMRKRMDKKGDLFAGLLRARTDIVRALKKLS